MIDFQALKAKVDFSEVDKARDAFKGLKEEIPGAGSAVDGLGDALKMLENPLVAIIGAFATATAGAITFGFKSIEAADAMNDLATRTGKSVEWLQVLGDVAEKSGSNLESMTEVLDQIQKKSAAGGEEGKRAGKAYEYLGISARDANGNLKEAATLAEEGAAALDRLGHSADATVAFQDAFGQGALKNFATLKELNSEIDKQYDFLASVGALMDGNLTKASDDYNDKLHDLGSIFKGLGNDIARIMLPLLTGLAEAMINSGKNSGLLSVALSVVEGAIWLVTAALKGVLTFFQMFDNGFSNIVQSISLGGKVIWAALTGNWDEIPKLWEDYKTRIIQTNVDAAEAVSKTWSTVEAAPQSKDDFKKGGGKGPKYNPYSKPDKEKEAKDPAESDYLKDMLALDKAILKLKDDYLVMNGAQSQSHSMMLEADIAAGKYKEKVDSLGKVTKLAAKETEIDALRAKAAQEDELVTFDKLYKVTLAAADAVTKGTAAARNDVEQNRIRIEVMKKFGATQDDVNQEIADYNLKVAQKALADGIENEVSEEKLIKLRAEIALLKERKQAAGEIKSDNDAETKRQSTFEFGWKSSFDQYKKDADDAAKHGADAFKSATGHMEDALLGFVTTGKLDFGSLAASILSDLAKIAIQKTVAGIAASLFADGGAFSGGTQFFADGGVVSSPTAFGMAGGKTGVMGEAGPEAIMPLSRGADGKLGVRTQGASASNQSVVNNLSVSIGSVDSEQRKEELLSSMRDMMVSTAKQTMSNEMRQGGMLNRRYAA